MDAAIDPSPLAVMMTISLLLAGGLPLLVAAARLRGCAGRPLDLIRPDTGVRPPITAMVGRWVTRVLRQRTDATAERWIGRTIVGGAFVLPFVPLLGVAAIVLSPVVAVRNTRKRNHAAESASVDAFSELIDLFAMALSSGATVTVAVQQAGTWAPEPFRSEFSRVVSDLQIGKPLADSLEAVPLRTGTHTRPLVAALVAHGRYGAPILQSLAQLASDARSDRRRRAEAAARRLPVILLFPLVVCVLPAFLLLTVVPVVIDTVSSLQVFASP